MNRLPPLAALLLAAWLPVAARAAQSFDNCTGYIQSLPTNISTQGYWCMRGDLNTSVSTGAAITVDTNNVTIDCNHFKLGGLQAGDGTQAKGLFAQGRKNVTVRNCNVRGFKEGIYVTGTVDTSRGHVIEDNRLDNNTLTGIFIAGEGSMVRRNLVINTGGSTFQKGYAYGISARYGTDVLDNTVHGLVPLATDTFGTGTAYGVHTYANTGAVIAGNRIRGLKSIGAGVDYAVIDDQSRMVVRDNEVIGDRRTGSIAFKCAANVRAAGNVVIGFQALTDNCTVQDNVVKP